MDTTETQLKVEEDEHLPQIPSLPQEIIADILSRLPVKSVCKFRCVSKLWLSITSDPFFTKAHLKRTLKDANFRSPSRRILISSPQNLYSVVDYETIGVANGEILVQELHCPLRDGPMTAANRLEWVDILGSCNGLACIHVNEDTYFLFNPTTGESKQIRNPDGQLDLLLYSYGFGYDEVHYDFKVVKLFSDTGMIYSARNDAWRRVVHVYEDYPDQMAAFLDGAIHWVFSSKDEMGGSKTMVVVLDLATETFWDMRAPDGVDGGYDYSTGALNGCLCLHHICNGMQDHFWVMNEYGVSES